MRRLLFLMAALVLCFCGCREDVQQQKKLVMATNATFPPYEYVDKGRIDGIDAEIVRRIAMRLGYDLEIEDMAFDAVIAAVQTGKAQVAASGITVTEDRKQKVFFTDSYVIAAQVMIVLKNSPIKSAADLKGKRIGVQRGTTGESYVKDNIQEPERFQNGPEAVTALANGKLDVVVIDGEPAEAYVAKNPNLKILPEPLVQEEYAFAIGKNNKALLDKFNAELRKMKESGELAAIINSYRKTRLIVVFPANSGTEKLYTQSVLEQIAERLKFKIEFQDGNLENVTDALNVTRKQLIVPMIPLTAEEENLFPNVGKFTAAEYVVIVPEKSPILKFSDLNGKKVGTRKGSFAEHYLEKHVYPPQTFPDAATSIAALSAGNLDAVVIDKNTALNLLKNNKNLKIMPGTFARETYVFAAGKENPDVLKEFLASIKLLQSSGELNAMLEKAGEAHKTPRQAVAPVQENAPAMTDTFWGGIKFSFYNNFIKDQRYTYLVQGFFVTLQITVLSVLMGIVIGFLVAVVRSTADITGKLKLLDGLCRIYLTVIRGTPVVVQLLIIYFVIFGSVDVNKVLVAVIAFGINSGAYVAEIIRGGIMSIDKGQMEAGRSLGLSYGQTMREIILPQAFKNVLPALGNEFIVLLKETSVAGYIALQDLTRGGDIIRSQTYDAFFPLIAVALIYLVVVMFLSWLLGRLEKRLKRNE